jgi:hypothetical protein
VSFEHFSGDGAQVADASAALIFLVRFCIKAKMNGIDGQKLQHPVPLKREVQGDSASDAPELLGSCETVR